MSDSSAIRSLNWRPYPFIWRSLLLHSAVFVLCLFLSFMAAYGPYPPDRDGVFDFGSAYYYYHLTADKKTGSGQELVYWFSREFLTFLPVTLVIKIAVFGFLGIYRESWRYVGLSDVFRITTASYISAFLCVAMAYLGTYVLIPAGVLSTPPSKWVPDRVLLLDWFFTMVLVASARISYRLYYEKVYDPTDASGTRLLIVGAGDVGDSILREVVRDTTARYHVIGLLDDNLRKHGTRIRGVDVLGPPEALPTIAEKQEVQEVLFAMPDAPQKRIRELVNRCTRQGLNLRFRTVPAVSDLIAGRVEISQIKPVDIEDLLGRDPITLDSDAIGNYLRDKVVLVTGAGGSIGSEMCRQICRFKPRRLLLVERMENALFEINRQLARSFPDIDRVPCVADIGDSDRIRQILRTEHPTAIFHAAAHKHVPMMEWNPGEAIKNNIVGTRVLADAANEYGIAKFVMISTDKAVNPTSVMGCTKRVAEMYVQQLSAATGGKTEFVTVRFGNVLGSSGSVVPIFKEQIARGGPVTITHRDMVRYFMTIPEASQLVLQAGAMGKGGEIFLLDMGEPVRILQLAETLITLSGLRPKDDIEIVETGMRPGEKLFEELSITGEDVSRTAHPKIGIIKKRPEDFNRVCQRIQLLVNIADTATPEEIRHELQATVPEYTPSVSASEPRPAAAPDRNRLSLAGS
ncbi:MAG TPA: nucleoside-diphosphate sugar epimerase/dehydratase [Phycisphaerae bacterium]|nr:nucleoside-diphosphate sugar epimerase/dehydratase [Phycisphaerae bacterium]HRY67943.1 nucleoside-diphosphate sugar epimerase/dehydratase [Phycisphaerae bacterium]HSA26680.1 nucleoside-diphosphate sugar epimerase/dehydratase [Phycisphaerae bacterium]